ncbi:hypothetical protein THAOC_26882, partial [Thalassiosira oceanica]
YIILYRPLDQVAENRRLHVSSLLIRYYDEDVRSTPFDVATAHLFASTSVIQHKLRHSSLFGADRYSTPNPRSTERRRAAHRHRSTPSTVQCPQSRTVEHLFLIRFVIVLGALDKDHPTQTYALKYPEVSKDPLISKTLGGAAMNEPPTPVTDCLPLASGLVLLSQSCEALGPNSSLSTSS